MDELHQIITQHEGLRLKPYRDTVGKLTIGVGRNLDDCGISEDEANVLLSNDITRCELELVKYNWYLNLNNDVRRGVLVELTFNVGISKVLGFKNMIAALKVFDYEAAVKELLNSTWAKQVGQIRANNMANRLLTGSYS